MKNISFKNVTLGDVLKQYRIEHWVQNNKSYKQVTISKYSGVSYRGEKQGVNIGRKRQFQIDLKKHPNTLLFIRQGVQDGGIGLAPKEVDGCIVTENMPMFSVEGINPIYLEYFIKSPVFKQRVNELVPVGSAQKALHEKELLKIEIPLPSKAYQNEIQNKLQSVEQKHKIIEAEINNQFAHLLQLRQAILQEAVQGKLTKQDPNDEPAEKLLQRIKAEKQQLITAGKLKKEKELRPITEDELPFELPKGWVWCRFNQICKVITCGMASTPKYYTEGRMFLSAKNIKPFKFLPEEHKFVDEETYIKITQNAKPERNDILITRVGAGIGESAIIDRDIEFAYYVSLTLVKPIQKFLNSNFILLWLNSPIGIKNAISFTSGLGGSQGNLNVERVRNFLFPLPSLSEQQRIVTKAEQLMQMVSELEQQVQQSKEQAGQLLQAVLKEAFSNPAVTKMYEENEVVRMVAEE